MGLLFKLKGKGTDDAVQSAPEERQVPDTTHSSTDPTALSLGGPSQPTKPDSDGPPSYAFDTSTGYPSDQKTNLYQGDQSVPSTTQSSGKTYTQAQASSSSPNQGQAILILASSGRLRGIGFSQTAIGAISDGIIAGWPSGIKEQGVKDKSWEWKFHGSPWDPNFSDTAHSRRLISHVLSAIYAQGWKIAVSTSLSRKWNDKDTLFFTPCPPSQRVFFAVSFHSDDKIRIVDPPDEGVRMAFEEAVHSNFPDGVQKRSSPYEGTYELKLKGHPWYASSQTSVDNARILAGAVIQALDVRGYELVVPIDMSVGVANDVTTMDTWFFAAKQ